MTIGLVPALLASVSIASIDIGGVVDGFTDARFITLVVADVIISGVAGAFFGYIVRFYAFERVEPYTVVFSTTPSAEWARCAQRDRLYES